MPLVPFSRQRIELAVSDRVVQDTRLKQKACFLSLLHEQDGRGESRASITVAVTMYATDGEGFGAALTGPGFTVRTELLLADNQTLVDATTGAILASRTGETADAWQAKVESFDQPTMLQGDFFEMLRETQSINIGDMIRQHIQQADAMGRFS